MNSLRQLRIAATAVLLLPLLVVTTATSASAATETQEIRFTTSDGVQLQTTLTGPGPLTARPTVIEFTPYGPGSATFTPDENYNHLLVQLRGTGSSTGGFDALGPRSQQDVAETLQWACEQPWSNGRLGIHGFSASAIIVYNSMHQELPCVDTATLRSGTFELYRDLLVPGGVSNIVPGAAVILGIGALALAQGPNRLATDPVASIDSVVGLLDSGLQAGFLHPTLDTFWAERGFRGDANDLPILAVNGIFDVESRGAFEGYQELRDNGSHLLLAGGHDGFPAGTDNGEADMQAWFDHYLRDIDNGIDEDPAVQLTLSDGDRQDMLDGQYLTRDATDWPVPGTTWAALNLDATRSGAFPASPNDGGLTLGPAQQSAAQSYVSVPSNPLVTDSPTTSLLGAAGLNMLTAAIPGLTDPSRLIGVPGLSYTSPALTEDVVAAGPASLEVRLSSTSPETAIWAIVSDVHPDGSAHPLTVGRLLSSFPDVVPEKSLTDENGTVVQPYGDYSVKTPLAGFLAPRLYQVEMWPLANRFKEGHRIRLDIVGASAFSLPTLPGVNTVQVGGTSGSRLLFPVLPESDLTAALPVPAAVPVVAPASAPPPAPVTTPAAPLAPVTNVVTSLLATVSTVVPGLGFLLGRR
ncbi:CocE/NonD family hydrolase [Aeromicrobium sp. Leaf350]|uniref:CocE/NonD family hydrolase n=1 Tax=Aeromicrobium sp. Leaf350 TaxID=2876565 RepID=UPI001E2BE5C7|nr:CocE/NonD family hydrolase [Aeromicrobium sp. Leaf350]